MCVGDGQVNARQLGTTMQAALSAAVAAELVELGRSQLPEVQKTAKRK